MHDRQVAHLHIQRKTHTYGKVQSTTACKFNIAQQVTELTYCYIQFLMGPL